MRQKGFLINAILQKLTGLSFISSAAITATDSILAAFGKLQAQINTLLGGVIYEGAYNATTNTPALTDGIGTKGYYYVVNVVGTQNFGSGSISFSIGDWVIYNGTIWQKVDNSQQLPVISSILTTGSTLLYAGLLEQTERANTSGGAFTTIIPTAIGHDGYKFNLKKISSDSNLWTISTTGGQTIDGSSTIIIASQYDCITIQVDGSNFIII